MGLVFPAGVLMLWLCHDIQAMLCTQMMVQAKLNKALHL